MASNVYLQIDGIKSDSHDDQHKEWIEVLAWSHSVSQPFGGASSAQGAHTGARADHADFMITKNLCPASPVLAGHCCSGKHIPKAKIEMCRQMGEENVIFMEVEFKDIVISSYVPSGSGDPSSPLPMEEIGIRYGEIHWKYTPTEITEGGKKKAAIEQGWSTLENKAK